jgi:hypothetical protein
MTGASSSTKLQRNRYPRNFTLSTALGWQPAAGGAAHVFQHLLALKLGDFNFAAPAPMTAAKSRMIDLNQSDLGAWCRALRATPDAVLRVGEIKLTPDLFTAAELLAIYDGGRDLRTTANGLSRELTRAGFRQVIGGSPCRMPDGKQGRFYAVRNADKWLAASRKAVEDYIAKVAGAKPNKKAR